MTVEMDDRDFFREGQGLLQGDAVVVTGMVNSDLWQAKRIEASSVYVKNLDTHFFASGANEEDVVSTTVYIAPAAPSTTRPDT